MSHLPEYRICPGRRIEVEVHTPDGARALVVGRLDAVPVAASGGVALRLRVVAETVRALPAG